MSVPAAAPFRTAITNVRPKATPSGGTSGSVRADFGPETAPNPMIVRAGQLGYEAASYSPRIRNWRPAQTGPNALLGYTLPTLRARTRDQVRQNGLAAGITEVLVSNIVGTGIKPQFNTGDPGLDREAGELFDVWTDESDADDGSDFYGQQALAVASMVEGGDSFARFRTRLLSDGLTVPFQIQLIEAEQCPENYNITVSNGRGGQNYVRNGIERDAIGNRVAYWMYPAHPFDWGGSVQVASNIPKRVMASEVAHLRRVLRPGMLRGEPWHVRTLLKMHDIDQYDDAQVLRQKIAAMFTGFVEEELPDPPEDGQEQVGQVFGGPVGDDGTEFASLEAGTIQSLSPGQKMTFSEPPSPGDSYEAFMKVQLRMVAVAAGILYEQLTGDYTGVNDRTWRAAVSEFRRRCARWQHQIVAHQFCRPVLARWADLAILSGALTLPRGMNPAKLRRARWVPQRWAYINPTQDIEAEQAEIRAGFKSRSQAVSERGEDAIVVDQEQAADNKRADSLGVVYTSDGRVPQTGGKPLPPPSENDPAVPAPTKGKKA